MKEVISVEHLTKKYDLGVIGTGTISRDLNRWWARVRKQPDPYTRIGQQDAFARIGESILALDDVSFTVQQGEALGIIGRNGAGKSTLLKILSRVTAPTSGVVKVKGRIGSLLEVGTGFHPELTGRENIYLNGAILGMKKAEVTRKFDEIVDFAGVEKFIDTPVKRYSSGMYVRLAFAVAAHLDPEILIVDEVLAVGDAEFQKKCLGKMGDVTSKEGRTVIFVSHNMVAVKTLCQKGIFLNSGKNVFQGTSDETVAAYLNSIDKPRQSDISLRTDRHGSGISRITKVEILSNEKMTNTLVVGTHVAFRFLVSSLMPNLSCIFSIYDQDSQAVATFNSKNIGLRDEMNTDSESKFVCELERLSLYPGRYSINVALYSGVELQDHIEGVLFFDVEPGRIEGRDIQPNRYARVYLDHKWTNPKN